MPVAIDTSVLIAAEHRSGLDALLPENEAIGATIPPDHSNQSACGRKAQVMAVVAALPFAGARRRMRPIWLSRRRHGKPLVTSSSEN